MAAKTYRLRIIQEGREFEAEGDRAFVLEMLRFFGPQAQQTPITTIKEGTGKKGRRDKARVSLVPPTSAKSLSIREFVQQMALKKHTDITLAFGYYLERYQGLTDFTPADINNCYYEAKLEPSNTSQMIVQNIKRGFLMASKDKSQEKGKGKNRYTLTASGETFIESRLPSRS